MRLGLGLLSRMLLVFVPVLLLGAWALLAWLPAAGTPEGVAASFAVAVVAVCLAYRVCVAPPLARLREHAARERDVSGLNKALEARARSGEEALRTSEARLRAVLDSVADCIVIADASGRIGSLNRAGEAMFGPARDLVGRPVAVLLANPDAAADLLVGAGARRLDGRRFDGGVLPLEITVVAIPETAETLLGLRVRAEPDRADGGKSDFLATVTIASVGRPPAIAEPAGPGLRVLVAEDNRTNQVLIRAMLGRLGHRADLVGDGLEAVAAITQRPYDMVLMDVTMPELDGLEATRRIRAMAGPISAVPIFGLTAHAAPSEHAACRDAGMDRVITKPVTIAGLADAIGAVAAHLAAS